MSLNQCCLTNESNVNPGFQLVMACQDYFHLGAWNAKPIVWAKGWDVCYAPENIQIESSIWVTGAKVASWILSAGILPLLAALVVLIAQSSYMLEMDQEHFDQYAGRLITETDRSWETYDRNRARDAKSCDEILENLYLGDGLSFLDCTDLNIHAHDLSGRPIGMRKTGNPLGFKNVITLCPLHALSEHMDEIQEQAISQALGRTGVNWMYVGKGISDGSSSDGADVLNLKWAGLVYDCTFESELSNFDPVGKLPSAMEKNLQEKQRVLQEIQPNAFFEKTFEVIDRAVFNHEKTLVHCAQGVSRSASLVIAWVMKRSNCKAEKATAFVRSKRPCVDPRFKDPLKRYEELLPKAPSVQQDA